MEHVAIGAAGARLMRAHAVDADRAAGRSLEIRDRAKQCALAAARRSDEEGDELAPRDLEIDVAQVRDLLFPRSDVAEVFDGPPAPPIHPR
jgi:hypothetical protein